MSSPRRCARAWRLRAEKRAVHGAKALCDIRARGPKQLLSHRPTGGLRRGGSQVNGVALLDRVIELPLAPDGALFAFTVFRGTLFGTPYI